ncbi:MAG: DMT family transporter [Anaerovoracaceae bacterium]
MGNKNKNHTAVTAIVFTNILWAFDFIAIDYMTDFMPASTLTFLRLLISSIIVLSLVLIKEKKLHIKKRDWPRVFFCGAIGMTLYTWLEGMGIHRTSGALASLILAMVPVFGLAVDILVYKKKMTPIKIMGVIGSIVGVFIVIAGSGEGGFSASFIGIALMLAAAVAWTAYIVLVKPLNEKYSLPTLLAGIMVSGTITALPLFLSGDPKAVASLTPGVWAVVASTSVVCLIVGQLLYVFGVSRLSITNVAVFENILPIVTVMASMVIFGDTLTVAQIIGSVVIMTTCTAVSLSEEREAKTLPLRDKETIRHLVEMPDIPRGL